MMIREFDVISIFENVFGYKPKPYHLNDEQVISDRQINNNSSLNKSSLQVYKDMDLSMMGLTHYNANYNDPLSNSAKVRNVFLPVWLENYMLPFPVVDITCRNNIVETVMVNRNGTVKEYISQEDYKIGIKGIIIREDGQYPEFEIDKLNQLFGMRSSLDIQNALTDIFFVNNGKEMSKVVMTDLKFPATVGVKNAKAYDMSLVSDRAFELYIK